jgi:hypothetical protein
MVDLVCAWTIGFLVGLAGAGLVVTAVGNPGGTGVLLLLPFLAGAAASWAHPAPQRASIVRQLVAALPPPLVLVGLGVATASDLEVADGVLAVVAWLVAALSGVLLVRLLRARG